MKENFFSFNRYLREKFGQRVHRISIDAGFDCPNIDGVFSDQGCIFCNNKGFGVYARSGIPPEEQIKQSIEYYGRRMGVKKFIAYFQSFTNTYADPAQLEQAYNVVKKFPQIVGISISTRPDCVDEDKIKLISRYKKDYLVWIEYGLQTTNDRVLKTVNRNHTYRDFLNSLELSRKYHIDTALHYIFGLPGCGYEDMMQDARRLSKLDIQAIKFHCLHVLKGTPLEQIYDRGELELISEQDYVKIVCDFLEIIPSSVVILRLVSGAAKQYLVAPSWVNRKAEVLDKIRQELEKRNTYQGYRYKNEVTGYANQ